MEMVDVITAKPFLIRIFDPTTGPDVVQKAQISKLQGCLAYARFEIMGDVMTKRQDWFRCGSA